MAAAKTIRERILASWAKKLSLMKEPDYHTKWDKVMRSPMPRKYIPLNAAVSILDIAEKETPRLGVTDVRLEVLVEFIKKIPLGAESSTSLNETLGDLKKVFKSDINTEEVVDTVSTCLTLNIEVISNELDYDFEDSRMGGGYLTLVITYRQNPNDPTLLR